MIQGKFLFYLDDLSEVFDIRSQVFQKELGIDSKIDEDGLDLEAAHVLVFNDENKPVATGRLLFGDNNFRIGRVAVLKEERGKYYGDFVVRMLADKAFLMGAEEVSLCSMCNVQHFYEKIGFESVGDEFEVAGIRHITMVIKNDRVCKKCSK